MVTGMGMKAKRSEHLPEQEAADPGAPRRSQFLHMSKTWASGKQAQQMLQLWVKTLQVTVSV